MPKSKSIFISAVVQIRLDFEAFVVKTIEPFDNHRIVIFTARSVHVELLQFACLAEGSIKFAILVQNNGVGNTTS